MTEPREPCTAPGYCWGMAEDYQWWRDAVRPEWAGHTWRACETHMDPALLAEARVWADAPDGVLYICAKSLRSALSLAIGVSQRAGRVIGESLEQVGSPLAVGLLDDLSIPEDPDPDHTEKARLAEPLFAAAETRFGFRFAYGEYLAEAPLTLLRLPATVDNDVEAVLDHVADKRREWRRPTIVASVVPPGQVSVAYGKRIAWRLGFASPDGTAIRLSEPDAAVLDVDAPPR
jgi:hypothetical protein